MMQNRCYDNDGFSAGHIKDVTEIFSKAAERSAGYEPKKISVQIKALGGDIVCAAESDSAYDNWFLICRVPAESAAHYYGWVSARYPAALLTEYCPAGVVSLLDENGVLHTEFEEPMSCDENVLRKYVPQRCILSEDFLDSGYRYDDERFEPVLYRLETGHKLYVDADCFTLGEIN